MVTSISRSITSTFLSPGQRFVADDIFSTTGSRDVTVARLVRDDLGMLHVVLRDEDNREISAYVASGEPADKAGAYGIQGLGGALVARSEGSSSNVVGLPLAETLALLDAAGVPHALRAESLQA